jgi:hypothetical protein
MVNGIGFKKSHYKESIHGFWVVVIGNKQGQAMIG